MMKLFEDREKLKKVLDIGFKVSIMLAIVIFSIGMTALISNIVKDSQFKNKIFSDIVEVNKINETKEEELRKDFVNKCLLARQVYQFSWYKKTPTKIGDLQLEKYYAMSLDEYDRMIDKMWEYNKQIGIPRGSWEQYIPLSKYIMESAICNWIEHKTGEIIKLCGYTEEGMRDALFRYLYESHIDKGHPLYIPELFKSGNSLDDLKNIFNNHITGVDNTVKFDYAYTKYLLGLYNYDWSWSLTGFHFGIDLTEYWKRIGLTSVPSRRIDGRWKDESLREYYQSIFEIAQGISMGNLARISRFEEIVGYYQKMEKRRQNYIDSLRLKVRSEHALKRLEEKYNDTVDAFTNFKKLNKDILMRMAEYNDFKLDPPSKPLKEKMRETQRVIKEKWKLLIKIK